MAEIGALNVTIGANTQGLERGMSRAKSELRDVGRQSRQAAKAIAVVTAAATAAAVAFAAFTKSGMNAIDAQAKLARQLDSTIGGLRGLQLAAEDAGVSTNVINSAMERFSARLGEAMRGTGQAAEALENLGLSAQALANMDVDERVAVIADRVRELGLSGAQTADVLRQFGIRNREIVNLMRQGGDAIRSARQEVEDYGLAVSAVDASAIEAANDAFSRVSLVVESLKNTLAVELAPFVLELADRFNTAAREADGFREEVAGAVISSLVWVGRFLDAVEGVRRSFVVVGKSAAAMALAVNVQMAKIAEFIYSGPVDAVNALIDAMNRLPLTDFERIEPPEIAKETQRQLEILQGALEIAKQDISDTMAAPLPSQGIADFVDDVEERIKGFREKFESEGGLFGGAVGGGGAAGFGAEEDKDKGKEDDDAGRFLGGAGIFGEEEAQAFIERLRATLETRQEILREFDVLDMERQDEKFEADMERLREALEMQAITEDEFRQARLEAEQRHWQAITGMRENAFSDLARITAAHYGKEVGIALDAFGTIIGALAQHSETAFKIQKAAAITSAVISAYEGISRTLGAYPYPVNIAMAAAHAATAFAQISKIKSQSFQGGGAASASFSGGGGGGAAAAGGGGGSQQQQTPEHALVTIQGLEGDRLLSSKQVRMLIEDINDAQENGARIRIAR